jgi:hypothetical protein
MVKGQTGRGASRRRSAATAAAVLLLVLCAACGGARPVLVEPGGGIVALSGSSGKSRAGALEIMSEHCPAGYEIVREEEVPVGSRVREETTADLDRKDRITSTTEYTVRTRYEWWIHYRCR